MSKKICLNMIVRNESKVIARCLASLAGQIDYWVIVDTGSDDGTQEIVKNELRSIPGELHERNWVDFGFNRNEALELALTKADYTLFIDADDRLVGKISKSCLDKDYYAVEYRKGSCTTKRILLASQQVCWRWEGAIHEAIYSLEAFDLGTFSDVWIEAGLGGYRQRNPETLKRDIELLKRCLAASKKGMSRILFHLAVFSEEAGDFSFALECFEKRATLGGWDQEVFYALYRKAALEERLGASLDVVQSSYEKAFAYRPSRSEPLVALALLFIQKKHYELAYPLLKKARSIPKPQDTIYVMQSVYEYEALFALAGAALHLGKYREAFDAYGKLLNTPQLPSNHRQYLEKNRFQVMAKAASTVEFNR
ncbi:MAG: glycosyltransferase family 2 protein [Chlamydiae bacterium]|nr:glycosyltransferase family 2 protein [Chlamydiota bacterium]